jgi:3-methyladenine DNA glycosylase AlkD
MNPILKKVQDLLHSAVDPKAKESLQRFFKSEIQLYGVRSPLVKKIAKDCFKEIKSLPKTEIFALCEELFKSGFCEEAWIAAAWADGLRTTFTREDIVTFERWISFYIDDWAKCDAFCTHAVGFLLLMYPELAVSLRQWAISEKPFLRRASAVSLIVPARKGLLLKDIFKIADILLLDQNDLVQKGYGWMLKETCKKHQKEVFDYVMKNKTQMPRVSLRYAIEKMPEPLRKMAMLR